MIAIVRCGKATFHNRKTELPNFKKVCCLEILSSLPRPAHALTLLFFLALGAFCDVTMTKRKMMMITLESVMWLVTGCTIRSSTSQWINGELWLIHAQKKIKHWNAQRDFYLFLYFILLNPEVNLLLGLKFGGPSVYCKQSPLKWWSRV